MAYDRILCPNCSASFGQEAKFKDYLVDQHGIDNIEQHYIEKVMLGVKHTCSCGCGMPTTDGVRCNMKISVRSLRNVIKEALSNKQHKAWLEWLSQYDKEFAASEFAGDYEGDVSKVPLYDVVDGDMVTSALGKLYNYAFDHGKTPTWAIEQLADRDKFAVKFFDPYEEEFKEVLGIDDEDEDEY